MPKFSIIIPTLGRSESYENCRESLWKQTNQDFEIVKVTEEGSLASLRNEGARRAKGQYLIFIDDDVVCSPYWLEAIEGAFDRGYQGVSGPSVITKEFRKNRDCFRLGFFTKMFSRREPGRLSRSGMWSMGGCEESCSYHGSVDYLEACNMAFEAKAFWEVGGFDEEYKGIGDWSEPDLCYRLRQRGYELYFSNGAKVEHRPSQSGAYKKRLVHCNRMENYELFSSRWIKPCLRHSVYKAMMRTYFWLKENKCL